MNLFFVTITDLKTFKNFKIINKETLDNYDIQCFNHLNKKGITMNKDIISLFEENILKNKDKLISVLINDFSSIFDYMETKVKTDGLMTAVSSECFQLIWSRFTCYSNCHDHIAHRKIGDDYYSSELFEVDENNKKKDPIFTLKTFIALNYGVEATDQNVEEIFIENFISKDNSRIVTNVPPMVVFNVVPHELLTKALSKLEPKLTKNQDFEDYFSNLQGYLNYINPKRLRNLLLQNIENYDFCYNVENILLNYSDSSVNTNEAISFKLNNITVSNLLLEFFKVILEKGCLFFLNLPLEDKIIDTEYKTYDDNIEIYDDTDISFFYNIIKRVYMDGDVPKTHQELLENFICQLSKFELKIKAKFSVLSDCVFYGLLIKKIEEGILENIYITKGYNFYILDLETIRKFNDYKSKIVFGSEFSELHWHEFIVNRAENKTLRNEYGLIESSHVAYNVYITLYAIFGKSIDDDNYLLTAMEIKEQQLKNKIIQNEINKNKDIWFNFKTCKKGDKEFEKMISVTDLGIKGLLSIQNSFL